MLKKILLLLLLVIIGFCTLFWMNKEQWLADFNQQRQQQSAIFKQKGIDFAKTANQQQCMEQSFKQLGSCFEFDCTLDQGVFVKACIETAAPSANFCDAVPKTADKLTQDDKDWLKDSCWDKDVNGEGCRFMYKQQIQFCTAQFNP